MTIDNFAGTARRPAIDFVGEFNTPRRMTTARRRGDIQTTSPQLLDEPNFAKHGRPKCRQLRRSLKWAQSITTGVLASVLPNVVLSYHDCRHTVTGSYEIAGSMIASATCWLTADRHALISQMVLMWLLRRMAASIIHNRLTVE